MAIKRKIKAKAKAPAIRKPSTAPIDAVRSPNFDAAMAQQNYQNSIADFRARMLAEQNAANALGVKYIATMGTSKTTQPAGNQDFIDSRDPNKMYTQDMVDYIDPATGERTSRTRGVVPTPGSRFVPANQAGGLGYNQIPPMGTGGTALPQEFSNLAPSYDVSKLISDYQAQRDAPRLMPIQTPGSNALNQDLANRGMGGGIPAPMPQGQQGATASQYTNPAMNQMADYNKMLQQGMQRNQDMNQAAQNFAGMGGPQRSFSQVVGGINRMNRAPKPQRNRSLAPSNQKLI